MDIPIATPSSRVFTPERMEQIVEAMLRLPDRYLETVSDHGRHLVNGTKPHKSDAHMHYARLLDAFERAGFTLNPREQDAVARAIWRLAEGG